MRPGMKSGNTHSIEIVVTPEMFARFEGELVHPVYSTATMVYHMEWVSRLLLLPFLENEEEGMGGSVSIKHVAPCLEGAKIKVTATVTDIQGNKVITNVRAESANRLIGVGEVKQVVLSKEKIAELLTGS